MTPEELLRRRPVTVKVKTSLDRVTIHFPAKNRFEGPRIPLHQAPLQTRRLPSLVIFSTALLLMLPLMLTLVSWPSAELLAMGFSLLIAVVATGIVNLTDTGLTVRSQQLHSAATVTLQAHQLTLHQDRSEHTFQLDRIEHVSVDRSGARLRIDGEIVPLLAGRTATEQAWLGQLTLAVWRRRKRGSTARQAEQQALQGIFDTLK